MGRPSVYDTQIKPHLDEIRNAVQAGATVSEIALALGLSESTIYKYKDKKKELSEAFARGRASIVIDIKAALLKKAKGFTFEEEKRVGRKDKSGENIILVEKYTRYQAPSETAAAMLLRNYDTKWRDSDSTSVDLRKQEHELRIAIAEANNFDLDFKTAEDKRE